MASRTFNVGVFTVTIAPSSGAVADTVTIDITGGGFIFDVINPENNVVIFANGIGAYPSNVISTTQLEVVVPQGSVSGDVRVSVGLYESDAVAFTVIPGLTSIFPQIVSQGASINIEGTGFSSVLTNNDVRFCTDITCTAFNPVTPVWATSTDMQVVVPSSAAQGISGPVYIAVNGVITSSSIPVLIAEDILNEIPESLSGSTTMTVGQTAIGSISQAGETDIYTFQGTVGNYLIIDMWAVDQFDQLISAGGTPDTKFVIRDASNWAIGFNDDDPAGGTLNSHLEVVLPSTGTYSIEALAASSGPDATGFYHLQVQLGAGNQPYLNQVNPAVEVGLQTITLTGGNFATPYSNNTVNFQTCSSASYPCGCSSSISASATITGGDSNSLSVIVPALPAGCFDGDWAGVTVDNGSLTSNSIPFTWFALRGWETDREIEYGPTPINIGINNAIPGSTIIWNSVEDVDRYTFSANAGDVVEFGAFDFYGTGMDLNLTLYAPDGSFVIEDDNSWGNNDPYIYPTTLTQTGQYTLEVECNGLTYQLLQGFYILQSWVNTPKAAPVRFAITAGNQQAGTVGTTLPISLQVRVTDSGGNGVGGVRVDWGNGDYRWTNATGYSSVGYTLGLQAGLYVIRPSVVGLSPYSTINAPGGSLRFEEFAVQVLPGTVATTIFPVFGYGQLTEVDSPQANQVCVQVTDASGSPVAGENVNFSILLGDGSVFPGSDLTDSYGLACTTWTMGPCTTFDCFPGGGPPQLGTISKYIFGTEPYYTLGGINRLAAFLGASGVVIEGYSLPMEDADVVNITSGDNQSIYEGQEARLAIQVSVRDANYNPISNAEMTFTLDPIPAIEGVVGGIFDHIDTPEHPPYMLLLNDPVLPTSTPIINAGVGGLWEVRWVAGDKYLPGDSDQYMTITSGTASTQATLQLIDPAARDNDDGVEDNISHFVRIFDSLENQNGGLIDHELPAPIIVNVASVDTSVSPLAYVRSASIPITYIEDDLIGDPPSGTGTTDTQGALIVTATLGSTSPEFAQLTAIGDWGPIFTPMPITSDPGIQYPVLKATKFKMISGSSNQFKQPGEAFEPVTFKVEDDFGNPIPDVKIERYFKEGDTLFSWNIAADPVTTNSDGEATFSLQSNVTRTGGAVLMFRVADSSIRDTLTDVIDERGFTEDSNRIPYISPSYIPKWCSSSPCKDLRLRLVRAARKADPLTINLHITPTTMLDLFAMRVLLEARGYDDPSLTLENLYSETAQRITTIFNNAGVQVNVNTGALQNRTDQVDVIVGGRTEWPFKSKFCGLGFIEPAGCAIWGPFAFGYQYPPDSTYKVVTTLRFQFSAIRYHDPNDPNSPTVPQNLDNTSNYLANLVSHEVGHHVGLVNPNNLLGYKLGDGGKKWLHNHPSRFEFIGTYSFGSDLMDHDGLPYDDLDPSWNFDLAPFREVNQFYLKMILPNTP